MTETRDSLPLRDTRVLVTRASGEGDPLRDTLEAAGAEVVVCPTIEIVPPESFEALDIALRYLDRYSWIAFTSQNAVGAVFERLTQLGRRSLPAGLRAAAVGASTAQALEERGVQLALVPAEASASGLAAALVTEGVEGAWILLPVGDIARPELRDELERAGAHVDSVVVYRTVAPRELAEPALRALKERRIDYVALASPSAFSNLLAMLGADADRLGQASLACIGPTTAAAVREIGMEPAAMASNPTLAGLAESIIAHKEGKHD